MNAKLKKDICETQIKYGCGKDPRGVLQQDKIYKVTEREEHSWHTRIYLEGVDGWFNSVLFDYF